MKDILDNILNSKLTSIGCLIVAAVINEFTYAISGGTIFRLIEILLFIVGIVAAWRNYPGIGRIILTIICAIGLLISVTELFDGGGKSPQRETYNNIEVVNNGGMTEDNANNYYQNWPNNAVDNNIPNEIKEKCYHCKGSGICTECDGEGRITIKKYTSTLGHSYTYNQYTSCPLCNRSGKCVWCEGKGYILY